MARDRGRAGTQHTLPVDSIIVFTFFDRVPDDKVACFPDERAFELPDFNNRVLNRDGDT
jgi:hypothetical protein